MTKEKTTRQVVFEFDGQECRGYEIHQGVSDTAEAIVRGEHCIGTYIHGFLDNAPVIEHLLSGGAGQSTDVPSMEDFKQLQYDRLAEHVRQHVDVERIYKILSDD